MAWSVWVAVQPLQELPNRPITRDGIWNRDDALEKERAIFVTPYHSTTIRSITVRILHVVEPFRPLIFPGFRTEHEPFLSINRGVSVVVSDRRMLIRIATVSAELLEHNLGIAIAD